MKYIVGAYATAPSSVSWDKELESQYYQQLKAIEKIKGIEHPFVGKLHAYDDDWFLANIDTNWQFIFTSIPGVMANIASAPHFGIASTNEEGRQAALAFYQQANQAILKLNHYLNKQAVSFIKIHTAPRITTTTSSSTDALQASLETMLSWDWDGAKLVIEHCDAFVPDQAVDKGFMTLADEISTVRAINKTLNSDIGISINWGRSAIESRSASGPIEHIKMAYQSKLLKGIIFSGASNVDGPYGLWKDTHMPHEKALNVSHYAKGSLLTIEQIVKSLQQCDMSHLDFLGAKISLRPNNASVTERVSYIESLLSLIDDVVCTLSTQN